ncbi:hypothetical protein [Rhodoplanes sp. SY1]|uniref:hypothetical protein n=1 Tax=Rhodoplanes sp. SY1 TaxID=3166646 RepID=UPI0038B4E3E8
MQAEPSRDDHSDPDVLKAALRPASNNQKPMWTIMKVFKKAERHEDYRARLTDGASAYRPTTSFIRANVTP